VSLVLAFLLSSKSPAPSTLPKGLATGHTPGYSPFKVKLGGDEVVLVLHKNHSLRKTLGRLENRSLDASSVEVKLSATGGLGLFATKDFLPGDLVLSERPMVSALRCR
jgi:hypothetical protein